jgi:GNAT superfamily N-acetyltransferase
MATIIRDFTPEDYPVMTDLLNAVDPEYPETEAQRRFWDEHRDPKCRFRRWVAEAEGELVAIGDYNQSGWIYHPRKFLVFVAVHPEHWGRGIGRALYDHVTAALAPFDPIGLRSQAREDRARSVRFLTDRGFREDMRSWESRLDVRAFDFSAFDGAEERPGEHGIEILTLKELETDPDRDRKLYDLDWELSQDVPHTEPLTRTDYELWVKMHLRNPNLLPEGYFLAVHNGEYVGLSALWLNQATPDLFTGLTGVRREYRRKGIALALKLRAVRYARERGAPLIRTWNEIGNRGMLSINERLGFVKQPAWIEYVKTIKEEA